MANLALQEGFMNRRNRGRYSLEHRLGRGGMAEVWLATDTVLGRSVAVKVILSAFAEDPHFHERFLREARMVAQLDHPNIVPVYDFGVDDSHPFLVMPHLPGGTLTSRMASPQSASVVIAWLGSIAAALDYAHQSGVLHRDIKPGNILFGREDRPVLSDFGIARLSEATTRLTATGTIVGTPTYMAPELAKGEGSSPASDRYGLAIVAWEALLGFLPFDGENPLSVLHQQVNEPIPDLVERDVKMGEALQAVFEKALAKQGEARHESCGEFTVELADALGVSMDTPPVVTPIALRRTASPAYGSNLPTQLEDVTDRLEYGSAPTRRADSVPQAYTPQGVRRSRSIFLGLMTVLIVAIALGLWWQWPREHELEDRLAETVPLVEATRDQETPVTDSSIAPETGVESGEGAKEESSEPEGQDAVVEQEDDPSQEQETPPWRQDGGEVRPGRVEGGGTDKPATESQPQPTARDFQPQSPPGQGRPGSADSRFRGVGVRKKMDFLRYPERRLTRKDFTDFEARAGAAARQKPNEPMLQGMKLYAEGGIAYLDGHYELADAKLREMGATMKGRASHDLLEIAAQGHYAGEKWRLAVAFADARGEGERAVNEKVVEDPEDYTPNYARPLFLKLSGQQEKAIREADSLYRRAFSKNEKVAFYLARFITVEMTRLHLWDQMENWFPKGIRGDASDAIYTVQITHAVDQAYEGDDKNLRMRKLRSKACEINPSVCQRDRRRPG